MPSLCWRFNYRNIELHFNTKAEHVGVFLRDGDYKAELSLTQTAPMPPQILPKTTNTKKSPHDRR